MQLVLKGIPLDKHDVYSVADLQSAEFLASVQRFDPAKNGYEAIDTLVDPIDAVTDTAKTRIQEFIFNKLADRLETGEWQILSNNEHGIALELHTRLTSQLSRHLFDGKRNDELPVVTAYHELNDPHMTYTLVNKSTPATDEQILASAIRTFNTNVRYIEERRNTSYPALDKLSPNVYVKMMGAELEKFDPLEGHDDARSAAISASIPAVRDYETHYVRLRTQTKDLSTAATEGHLLPQRIKMLTNRIIEKISNLNTTVVEFNHTPLESAISKYFTPDHTDLAEYVEPDLVKVNSTTVNAVLNTVNIFGVFRNVNT